MALWFRAQSRLPPKAAPIPRDVPLLVMTIWPPLTYADTEAWLSFHDFCLVSTSAASVMVGWTMGVFVATDALYLASIWFNQV